MENMKTNTNETKLTKKDINSVSRRWIMGSQITWNYEKQMAVGYLWAMLPIIRKLYKDPEQQKEMLKTHIQFFNTTPIWEVLSAVSTLRQRNMRALRQKRR